MYKFACTIGPTDLIPKPTAGSINVGLKAVTPKLMVELLGSPRDTYGVQCEPVTNKTLKKLMVTESVGPFRVTGFQPAVRSLKTVFAEVAKDLPDLYPLLGNAGMLCCRLIRGSKTAISNHSWGTAIDIKLAGVNPDQRGNNLVQYGLSQIAPYFNKQRWFWGAAFRIEDAMHFEASETLIREWAPMV